MIKEIFCCDRCGREVDHDPVALVKTTLIRETKSMTNLEEILFFCDECFETINNALNIAIENTVVNVNKNVDDSEPEDVVEDAEVRVDICDSVRIDGKAPLVVEADDKTSKTREDHTTAQ